MDLNGSPEMKRQRISQSPTRTPRKLVLGSPDRKFALSSSQPTTATSAPLEVPSLQHPGGHAVRGREYSQSPPRSPTRSPSRSPTRKLELIRLSPKKNTRMELHRLYEAKTKCEHRLCIDRLVLRDFKSYAGTQIIGPFNTSFSAVVGPNGSGKSNVIDSMLFVFGFRANKMRQGKLSELIHKSETYPNLTSCSVQIHFQYVQDISDNEVKVIEELGTLVVERRAFKNNTSKYYVNGKESNFTEVTQLLKGEGIDLDHKRFLILQGEVESIAQMKPKAEKDSDDGLLEYLEDIIGTAKYKPQIERCVAEIETLNDICMEKENRFMLVDKERESLEHRKEEALEFLENEKQLTVLKSKILQHKLHYNNKKLSDIEVNIKMKENELEKEKQKYASSKAESQSFSDSLATLKKEHIQLMAKIKKTTSQRRASEQQQISLEQKIGSIQNKLLSVREEFNTSEEIIKKVNLEIDELRKKQIECEQQLKESQITLSKEKNTLEEIKLSLHEKTHHLSAEIETIERQLEPSTNKIHEINSEIKLTEAKITMLRQSRTTISDEIKDVQKKIASLEESRLNSIAKLSDLSKEKHLILHEIEYGEKESQKASLELKSMNNILQHHRQAVFEAKSNFSGYENRSKVLVALSKLQKSGRINGFHGRLGDLGTIDDTYDIAISTACPRLDDIVVDSVECAQHCINYLRKNRLGYARFILLDKLRTFNLRKIETPENVPRLFDLVKPNNEKFRPAFYSVLRDTLVALDLMQANRIAYQKKRFRVVTLDGKLIDVSGTISGGGNSSNRGLMKSVTENKSSLSSEDIHTMESQLAEKEQNYNNAFNTLREMDNALDALKERVPEVELQLTKTQMNLDSYSSENQNLDKRLRKLVEEEKNLAADNQPLLDEESKLSDLRQQLKYVDDESSAGKEKIKEIKEKIMQIGGSQLKSQCLKVESIEAEIKDINSEHRKNKTHLKKAELEVKRHTEKKKRLERDQSSCESDLLSLKQNLEDIEKLVHELEEMITEHEDRRRELDNDQKALEDKLYELDKFLENFERTEISYKNALEKLYLTHEKLKKETAMYENSFASLKIRDVTKLLSTLETGSLPFDSPMDEGIHSSGSAVADLEQSAPQYNNTDGADLMDIDSIPTLNDCTLPRLSVPEIESLDVNSTEEKIREIEIYLENSNGDIEVLEEYAKRLAEYRMRKLDLNEAVSKRDDVQKRLEELRKMRLDEFMEGFGIISMTLKEMYQMITMGGNAELELVDSLDPFSEGVLFSVMPPKKSWRNISNLSGGEKTLSSLALVFALHKYKPTPLYVMDEIDAALDFRNVSIVANYIKERTKNAQFIVISLRNNMFELARHLVGIYKNNNMTRSTSIENADIINVN